MTDMLEVFKKLFSTLSLLKEAVARPWRWILVTLYGVLGLALTLRSELLSPEYQQYTIIWLVSQLSWPTWLIFILLITLLIVVIGYHQAHNKIINKLSSIHQSELVQVREERDRLSAQVKQEKERVNLLQTTLKEKEAALIDRKNRKFIREELGKLYSEGDKLAWQAQVDWLTYSKPYNLLKERVKQFLSEQLDGSYVARFETRGIHVLDDFIKELAD